MVGGERRTPTEAGRPITIAGRGNCAIVGAAPERSPVMAAPTNMTPSVGTPVNYFRATGPVEVIADRVGIGGLNVMSPR